MRYDVMCTECGAHKIGTYKETTIWILNHDENLCRNLNQKCSATIYSNSNPFKCYLPLRHTGSHEIHVTPGMLITWATKL